ncbi:MAG: creatininase family protein [Hyphomicrobiaceae bacterium]
MSNQSVSALRDEGHRVAALPWDAVERRLRAGGLAILPVGAGAKEHGFHLPMGSDALQADWIVDRLAARLYSDGIDLIAWPVVSYGYYPAFAAYAGSITLQRATFAAVIGEIVTSLQGHGARAVLVLDTGVSTGPPIAEVITGRPGCHHLKIHAGPRYRETAARIAEQPYGSHADELETSRMLASLPEWVDMARAVASPVHPDGPRPGALTPSDASSPNYSPSGAYGDPTLATGEKGEALLEAMLSDLQVTIREVAGAAM